MSRTDISGFAASAQRQARRVYSGPGAWAALSIGLLYGAGLMLYCMRGLTDVSSWNQGLLKTAFWSLNIGLAMMIFCPCCPRAYYKPMPVLITAMRTHDQPNLFTANGWRLWSGRGCRATWCLLLAYLRLLCLPTRHLGRNPRPVLIPRYLTAVDPNRC